MKFETHQTVKASSSHTNRTSYLFDQSEPKSHTIKSKIVISTDNVMIVIYDHLSVFIFANGLQVNFITVRDVKTVVLVMHLCSIARSLHSIVCNTFVVTLRAIVTSAE
jgi:hypothetical protein